MLEAFCNIAEMGRRYRAYRRWYFIYTQVPQVSVAWGQRRTVSR
jgi:hypothetical protein